MLGSHGRITMEKQFGTMPVPYPLQATVKVCIHSLLTVINSVS